jgi:hypothetical protein
MHLENPGYTARGQHGLIRPLIISHRPAAFLPASGRNYAGFNGVTEPVIEDRPARSIR